MSGVSIAVLDYGIGNLRSAEKALQHCGADAYLSADAARISTADAVVLPGVGQFGRSMEALRESGLELVAMSAIETGRPFFGICVGMQMLYESSAESPGVAGLGVLKGKVIRLPAGVKHPQMQWNRLNFRSSEFSETGLYAGLGDNPWMYFVHSFAPEVTADTVATCSYGGEVAAAAQNGNVMANQFHPEKSSESGLRLLKNFVGLVEKDKLARRGGAP